MLPASAGLDRRCPARDPVGAAADAYEPEMRVAAMINWFGITDVADLVEGPNAKTYAVAWMGGMSDWRAVADRVSPMNHVKNGLPPILTIHGNADPIVPYDHAVRLHEAGSREGARQALYGRGRGSRGLYRRAIDGGHGGGARISDRTPGHPLSDLQRAPRGINDHRSVDN